jgi:hypothetical protein
MWKKIIFSIVLLIIVLVGIDIFYKYIKDDEIQDNNTLNVIDNGTELSAELIKDDCINEWSDYATVVEEEIEEANSSINEEDRTYIMIAENDLINVYYINNSNEEILYKVTDISLEYLSEEDVEKLEQGIETKGIENLNKLLEDFE